ncbi:MAG: histidine kinase dimerization/phosphoacceptor domain -containing protein [Clostridiales bacterium]|nr:histidine kinase dimerization/phosphoacceptor domain -containing protein [Clostridiales bacterium]
MKQAPPLIQSKKKTKLKNKTPQHTKKALARLEQRLYELERKERKHRLTEKALRESEEKYRTVVDRANDGIAIIQDKIVQFANPRLLEIGGYSAEEVIGRPFTDFLTEKELQRMLTAYERGLAGNNGQTKFEVYLRKKHGDPFIAEINSSIIRYKNKEAALILVRDFTQRKKTERLKESIFRISEAAISSESLDDLYLSIHQVISNLMPAKNFYIALYDSGADLLSFPYFVDEYDPPPLPKKPGKGLTEYVLRTGRPLLASPEVFAELEARGEVESIGAPSIDWLGVPLIINGTTIGVLVVQSYTEGTRYGKDEMDILKFVSDQVAMAVHRKKSEAQIKASLEEKEVLLREVHHRVKNNMQVISSLLNLQSRLIADPAVLEMFKDSQRRIRSMALVHERLYHSSDLSRIEFSHYLRNLATHLFNSCQADSSRIHLRLDLEEVFLNINTAIPCGLIVNELISNALKHAFPEGRSGEVAVELRRVEGDGYLLGVRDNGVGVPEGLDFRQTETLGLQIVVTLVSQVAGELKIDRQNGTAFTLVFKELPMKKRA